MFSNQNGKQSKLSYELRKSLFKAHVRRNLPWPIRTKLRSPIFVLGSSRSGTTMLTDIFATATRVCNFSEVPIVRLHMWEMVKSPETLPHGLPQLEKNLVRLSGIKPRQRLLEKTPGHSLIAGALANYFTDGSFIHIFRDGRDVSNSMLRHKWISRELKEEVEVFWFSRLPQTYLEKWPSLEVWERGSLRWAVYVTAARKAKLATEKYLEVSYEDICSNPQYRIYQLFDFLNLAVSPDCEKKILEIRPINLKRDKHRELSQKKQRFYTQVLREFGLSTIQ